MNIFLTMLFMFFWMDEITWRVAVGQEYERLFWQGVTIILCGAYFAVQDLKEFTEEF